LVKQHWLRELLFFVSCSAARGDDSRASWHITVMSWRTMSADSGAVTLFNLLINNKKYQ